MIQKYFANITTKTLFNIYIRVELRASSLKRWLSVSDPRKKRSAAPG
jgi:hypothetical protein